MSPYVDWNVARAAFKELQDAHTESGDDVSPVSFDAVVSGDVEGLSDHIDKARDYANRLDATLESCPTGHAFFNGKHFDMNDDFLKYLQVEHGAQLQHLQEKVSLQFKFQANL